MPPKTIRVYNMSNKTIQHNIESMLKLEDAAKLSKHKVFEIVTFEQDNLIDLSYFQQTLDKQIQDRKQYNDGLLNIGEHVIIGNIKAVGPQWSVLKKGDIVPVIETPTKLDNQIGRGVWVRGLNNEPVKLLNEDGYNEFKFVELKALNLAKEFYSFKGKPVDLDMLELLMWRINNIQYEINHGEITLHDFCNEICEYIGVERRFHRSYFEQRLTEYIKKYTYFAELDRIKRNEILLKR